MLLRVYVNAAATSLMRDKSSSYCIEAVLTQDQVNTALGPVSKFKYSIKLLPFSAESTSV